MSRLIQLGFGIDDQLDPVNDCTYALDAFLYRSHVGLLSDQSLKDLDSAVQFCDDCVFCLRLFLELGDGLLQNLHSSSCIGEVLRSARSLTAEVPTDHTRDANQRRYDSLDS